MKHKRLLVIAAACLLLLGVGQARAAQFSVQITNLTNAIYFTPFLVTAHNANTHLFQVGTAASNNLQAMAEGGDISGLTAAVGGVDADTVADPNGGILGPGQSTTAQLNTDGTGNQYLSLVAMLLPTNDGFVGLDGMSIPDSGTWTFYLSAYDAGTEANNELIVPGSGTPGVLGIPADPGNNAGTGGTGVTVNEQNNRVHVHRGNLGDAIDPGGVSDLFNYIHRWLDPVARIVITVQ